MEEEKDKLLKKIDTIECSVISMESQIDYVTRRVDELLDMVSQIQKQIVFMRG